jgi:hypothetical protein
VPLVEPLLGGEVVRLETTLVRYGFVWRKVTNTITLDLKVFVVTTVETERIVGADGEVGATHVGVALLEEALDPDEFVEVVELEAVLLDSVVEV